MDAVIEYDRENPRVRLRCGSCRRTLDKLYVYEDDGQVWARGLTGEPHVSRKGPSRPSITRRGSAKAAGARGEARGPRGQATDRLSYTCKCGAQYDCQIEKLATAYVLARRADRDEVIAGVDVG